MSVIPIPASLQRRYDVCVKHIPIGRWTELALLAVRDPDVLLDRIDPEAFDRDERLPYWAEIWPAAIGMGLHLFAHPVRKDERALELGCGVGVAGIAAARAGLRVDACDYEEDALRFARHNAERNGVAHRMTFRRLDWRIPDLTRSYRMVFGSDIVYERPDHKPIIALLETALAPGGIFLMSDPNRDPAKAFVESMAQQDYGHTAQPWRIRHDGSIHRIVVHRFIKRDPCARAPFC